VLPTDALPVKPKTHLFTQEPDLNSDGKLIAAIIAGDPNSPLAAVSNVSLSSLTNQQLANGNYVISPQSNTTISTPMGTVQIDKGTIAFVSSVDGNLQVYDLSEGHNGGITVTSNGNSTKLTVGQEVLVTNKGNNDFGAINSQGNIAWRNETAKTATDGAKVFKAEFSIVSALRNIAPLKQLLSSSNPQAKKLIDSLLRAAVFIAKASPDAGEYGTSTTDNQAVQ
jgi:hypothetical protein